LPVEITDLPFQDYIPGDIGLIGIRTDTSMRRTVDMDQGLEKYRHLKKYLGMGEIELKKVLRMMDAILEEVESFQNMRASPELCLNVRDQAVRIRSTLSLHLVALEDLILILRSQGIEI
jgi:hypothetical protein